MLELILPMVAFALAASLSPGPVNLVALSIGLNAGLRSALHHVTGATLGFTLLLILIGLGLHSLLSAWPPLLMLVRWAGVLFLLYMAVRLSLDRGEVTAPIAPAGASWLHGALMQWLNPKAWVASAAGMGTYTTQGAEIGIFATVFFLVCYASITCWAALGAWLGRRVDTPLRLRWLNRLLAVLLAVSALALGTMPGGDTAAGWPPSVF